MKIRQFIKYFNKFKIRLPDEEQSEKRRTREKDLISKYKYNYLYLFLQNIFEYLAIKFSGLR